ncbi:MAG: AmmeMemoRadiSam system protein B [Phycisphaerales bacterium]
MSLRKTIDKPIHLRPPAVAGRFYPANPGKLRRDLDRYLQAAATPEPDAPPVRAIVAPHAGYIYSAPVAASAYRYVVALKGQIRRVVLIGPAHYLAFSGLAASSASAFQMPLGAIPVDVESTRRLSDTKRVVIHDGAHAPEHGLEVHLPFLTHTLCDQPQTEYLGFSILPLLFGDVGYEHVAEVLGPFFDDLSTLIVVSSDLSHYHDYETAGAMDRQTAEAIIQNRGEAVTPDRACGYTAIRALLKCVESRGPDVSLLDLRNSGDTAGPRDRVVGYGAFIIR